LHYKNTTFALFPIIKSSNLSDKKIIIIGAGLAGLTAAYFLKKEGITATILEARPRVGGRIRTIYKEDEAPIEMGATWLGKKHGHLIHLLDELKIDILTQHLGKYAVYEPTSLSHPQVVHLPPNNDPSFRIHGGTSNLINHLKSFLNEEQIQLRQIVQSIENQGNKVRVKTNKGDFYADAIISTLPPFLLIKTIKFAPALPANFTSISTNTHTWMGESIKVALTFKEAFWLEGQTSGTIMSNVGPIPEMYDQSDFKNKRFALVGFMNGSFFSLTKEERKEMILSQLEKYYGVQIHNFLSYEEAIWRKEEFTFKNYESHILPHQNNGNAAYQEAYFDGKLLIAGAETAKAFPGYMDGAVQSAIRAVSSLV